MQVRSLLSILNKCPRPPSMPLCAGEIPRCPGRSRFQSSRQRLRCRHSYLELDQYRPVFPLVRVCVAASASLGPLGAEQQKRRAILPSVLESAFEKGAGSARQCVILLFMVVMFDGLVYEWYLFPRMLLPKLLEGHRDFFIGMGG